MRRLSLYAEGKLYSLRNLMLWGTEACTVKRLQGQQIQHTEKNIVKRVCNATPKDGPITMMTYYIMTSGISQVSVHEPVSSTISPKI